MGLGYSVAFALGFISGLVFGYLLNKVWTFQFHDDSTLSMISKYATVYIVSLGLGLAFMRHLVEVFGLNPLAANFFVICLTTCTNFLGIRFLVFRVKT